MSAAEERLPGSAAKVERRSRQAGRRRKSTWSLRGFAAALSLTMVLPGAVIAFLAIESYREREVEKAFDEVARIQVLIAEAHEQWVASARDTLALVRNRLGEVDPAACNGILADALTATSGFDIFILTDRSGTLQCASFGSEKKISVADRDYYREAMATGKFAVGSYIIGRVSEKATLPMALPVFGRDDEPSGLLITGKQPYWIKARLSDRNLPEGTVVSILDREGMVFVHTGSEQKVGDSLSEETLSSLLVGGPKAVGMREHENGEQSIVAHGPIQAVENGARIVVEVPASSILSPIREDFLLWVGLILLMALLAATTVFMLIDHVLSQPLRALGKSLTAVANGNLGEKISLRTPFSEIQVLSRQANLMTRSLEKRTRETQRMTDVLVNSNSELEQFAQIASHDLQEPLRKISAFGSLLEKRYAEALDSEGRRYLSFMIGGALRSQKLIQELLAFSRIGRTTTPFGTVDLNRVMAAALDNIELAVKESGAKIEVSPLPSIKGDATQMERLIQNLLMNSIKYRSDDRDLVITVDHRKEGNDAVITISDNGNGFAPGRAEDIFLPFRRLVGASQAEGTGMGLAICRKIIERHGGSITATAEVGKGAAMKIVVPIENDGRA